MSFESVLNRCLHFTPVHEIEQRKKLLEADLKKHQIRFEKAVKSFAMSGDDAFVRIVASNEGVTLAQAKEKLFQKNKQEYIEKFLEVINDLYDIKGGSDA